MEPEDVTVIDSTSGRELQSQEEADAVASNTVEYGNQNGIYKYV